MKIDIYCQADHNCEPFAVRSPAMIYHLFVQFIWYVALLETTLAKTPDICEAVIDQLPSPLRSIAIYAPESTVVLQLVDDYVQLVPLSNFKINPNGTQPMLSLQGTSTKKWYNVNWIKAGADIPRGAHLTKFVILPKGCAGDTLILHYQINENHQVKYIYLKENANKTRVKVTKNLFTGSYQVTNDGFKCQGYLFRNSTPDVEDDITLHTVTDYIIVEDLQLALSDSEAPKFITTLPVSPGYYNFTPYEIATQDVKPLFADSPAGFMVGDMTFIMVQETSRVGFFKFFKLNDTTEHTYKIDNVGFNEFFNCSGGYAEEMIKPTEHNDSGFAFKLAFILVSIFLLIIIISIIITLSKMLRRRSQVGSATQLQSSPAAVRLIYKNSPRTSPQLSSSSSSVLKMTRSPGKHQKNKK